MVELPRDGYKSLNLSVLVIGLIMAVLAGLTVLVINYRIQPMLFGRLNLVHNAVRSIARGGALDQRVPVLGNDEIGALAEDFNAMVDSINHAQTQLADARRQAEEASQTKSQFLANISHEIRTPMTAILGYTELLRDGSLSQADQNRYLTIIQHNGDALLALINDVLDLSRIEAGQLHNEQRLFSVTELLDEVVDSLQDSFDLVVLDMQMPVMDGYEAAQALRDRGFAGPILALTANVLAVDRQRCMDAGCDAFLGKPIRVKQLITVCAGLLAQPEIPDGVAT